MVRDVHTRLELPREPIADLRERLIKREKEAEESLAKKELVVRIAPYRGNGVLKG